MPKPISRERVANPADLSVNELMPMRQRRWIRVLMVGSIAAAIIGLSSCATGPSDTTNTAKAAELEDLTGKSANALLLEGEAALQRKKYHEAARLLCAAAAASDDESLVERATASAYENHQDAYVLKCAQRWLEINSSSEQARKLAGFAALRLFQIDAAAEQFEVLIGSAFISPQAGFIELSPHWFEEGSRPAVLALLQKLITKHDGLAEAHYVLAQAALQGENIELALQSAKRATELSPYWSPARSLYARVQLAAGQRDNALATARAAMEQDSSPASRLEFAQIQYAAGQEEDGLKALRELSDSPEVGPIAARSLALIDMDRGDAESAIKRWRGLVQTGRFVYEGVYYLAQFAERRGETKDAIDLYTRVTGGDFAVVAQTRAAVLKARAGSVADGINVLTEYVNARPEEAIDVAAAQSALYAELGDMNAAVRVLDETLQRYPGNDVLRSSKALLLERAKRSKEALSEMRSLVHDRPNDPTALNMLGYTMVDRTRDYQEGLELIQRALQVMPDNAAILDSMGWALHRMHRDEEALPYLRRAHERARDAEIAVHLGDVLSSLGNRDEAFSVWEKALTFSPDNADLKDRVRKHKGK